MTDRPILTNDLIMSAIIGLRTANLPKAQTEEIYEILWKAWYKAYNSEQAQLEKAVDTTPAL